MYAAGSVAQAIGPPERAQDRTSGWPGKETSADLLIEVGGTSATAITAEQVAEARRWLLGFIERDLERTGLSKQGASLKASLPRCAVFRIFEGSFPRFAVMAALAELFCEPIPYSEEQWQGFQRWRRGQHSRGPWITIRCRNCGAEQEIPIWQADLRARKNKYFDKEGRSTLCRRCFVRRWHKSYKRKYGQEVYQDMLSRRGRRAKRSAPPSDQLQQLGAAAIRGTHQTTEFVVYRVLCRYARSLESLEFFLCPACGKLTSRHPYTSRSFGLGCFAGVRQSSEYGRWVATRRDVDPRHPPPWAEGTRSRRSSDTLRADLAILLQHYVLGLSVPELARNHVCTASAIQKALARCKAVLPDTWGHVFPEARGVIRTARIDRDRLASMRLDSSLPRFA